MPETLVSDNSTAFTSAGFQEFMGKNKIQHIKTAPYHPSSNGLAERAVQTFKRAIQKSLHTVDIQTAIFRFLFHYCSTPHSTTMISPAELLMNRRIHTRLEIPSLPRILGFRNPNGFQEQLWKYMEQPWPKLNWKIRELYGVTLIKSEVELQSLQIHLIGSFLQ